VVRAARVAAASLVLLLGACATFERPQSTDLTRSGRFALTAAWGEGDAARRESSNGRFTLHAGKGVQVLDLASPLGTTLARVQLDASGAILTTPAGGGGVREMRSADVESLTQEVLGFRLPVGGLADWIQGRPAPAPAPEAIEGDPRRPEAFVQNAWRIRIAERDEAGPRRLLLDYPAAGAPPAGTPSVRLTLLVEADAP
jgi:outer membrane lipoprotein LolB